MTSVEYLGYLIQSYRSLCLLFTAFPNFWANSVVLRNVSFLLFGRQSSWKSEQRSRSGLYTPGGILHSNPKPRGSYLTHVIILYTGQFHAGLHVPLGVPVADPSFALPLVDEPHGNVMFAVHTSCLGHAAEFHQ